MKITDTHGTSAGHFDYLDEEEPPMVAAITTNTDCEHSAEEARAYVENGGRITRGKSGDSVVEGGPRERIWTLERSLAKEA